MSTPYEVGRKWWFGLLAGACVVTALGIFAMLDGEPVAVREYNAASQRYDDTEALKAQRRVDRVHDEVADLRAEMNESEDPEGYKRHQEEKKAREEADKHLDAAPVLKPRQTPEYLAAHREYVTYCIKWAAGLIVLWVITVLSCPPALLARVIEHFDALSKMVEEKTSK
jgi:hypothetical protein